MSLRLMGKKRGMTQIFDETGKSIPCTVIEIEPNVVVQIKNQQTDGYDAVQLGFDRITAKNQRTILARAKKPLAGHFEKANAAPCRYLREMRGVAIEDYSIGQELTVSALAGIEFIDAMAISKGKGYQGVMKLHNFSGGPASHGASQFHRHAGSTGMRSTPGRCFPGGKRASHMGYERKTVQNLRVIKIMEEEGVILLKGAVPGPRNCVVWLSPAVKKMATARSS